MTCYIVYCLWEPKGPQKWHIKESRGNDVLNAGKPWLCFREGAGLTGVVGIQLEADSEQQAKEKMLKTIEEYKKAGKEPNIWY